MDRKHPELRRSKSMMVQPASAAGLPLPRVHKSQRAQSESSSDTVPQNISKDIVNHKKVPPERMNGIKASKNSVADAGNGSLKAGGRPAIQRRHSSREIGLSGPVPSEDLVKGMKKRLRKDEQTAGTGNKGNKKTPDDPPPKPITKSSFLSVTQRVSRLLKVRRAIMPRAGIAADHIKEEEVLSPEEIIQALPVTPRFSSFMSPEAQFAMMKGYEDLLHDQLSKQHPDCGKALKRTKTPHHGVAISEVPSAVDVALHNARKQQKKDGRRHHGNDAKQNTPDLAPNSNQAASEGSNDSSKEGTRSENNTTVYGADENTCKKDDNTMVANNGQGSIKLSLLHTGNSEGREGQQISPLQNLRRLSMSFPGRQDGDLNSLVNTDIKPSLLQRKAATNILTTSANNVKPKLSPHRSVTCMTASDIQGAPLPHNKRLVLSYRLESAMDLLDTIKPSSEYALSPRVKVHKPRVRPLAEFNHWTQQWTTEFKSDKV